MVSKPAPRLELDPVECSAVGAGLIALLRSYPEGKVPAKILEAIMRTIEKVAAYDSESFTNEERRAATASLIGSESALKDIFGDKDK